jgi:hypothetical protein
MSHSTVVARLADALTSLAMPVTAPLPARHIAGIKAGCTVTETFRGSALFQAGLDHHVEGARVDPPATCRPRAQSALRLR